MTPEKIDCSRPFPPLMVRFLRPVYQVDHVALGGEMRRRREACAVSLRRLAIAMGFSAPHLSDLERGRRNWTQEKCDRYEIAIGQIVTRKRYEELVKSLTESNRSHK